MSFFFIFEFIILRVSESIQADSMYELWFTISLLQKEALVGLLWSSHPVSVQPF
jgi:hypothetical protein